jgi:hypothetical protein
MDAYPIITAIHLFVGALVIYFAAKAFKKTKYVPMLFLAFGFILMLFGDTVMEDFPNIVDTSFISHTNWAIGEELFEIFGFVLVIVAILKS